MFLRPRRWGKTTFLQLLADYYDKSQRDQFERLFGQLYIGKHPTGARNSLLVLLFDFSSIRTLGSQGCLETDFSRVLCGSLQTFLGRNAKFLGNPNVHDLVELTSPTQSLSNVLVRLTSASLLPILLIHMFPGSCSKVG
jgi:hypothetical protein